VLGKLEGKSLFARQGGKININIKEIGCNNVDWIYLAQETDL